MKESTSESTTLKRLPLDALHRTAGAKMVPFAGYAMPLKYGPVESEWKAVRERCGLFDISHMGLISVRGHGTVEFLDHVLTNEIESLRIGYARYSLMCNPTGGIIDDLIVYRYTGDTFMLVVNGATKNTDYAWLSAQLPSQESSLSITDHTSQALFALQGPHAKDVLASLAPSTVRLKYYTFCDTWVGGRVATVARLGYTGEDGFEILCNAEDAPRVWSALCEAGKPFGLALCGLAARDILRLEAGMPLYGKDLDETRTPLEAGLDRFIAFEKPDFVGKEALEKQKGEGIKQRLMGFSRGLPVHTSAGTSIFHLSCNHEERVGVVTSGVISPQYGGIGMAYIDVAHAMPGSGLAVFNKNFTGALISALPFYRRKRTTTKEV